MIRKHLKMKYGLVTTTINIPYNLEAYVQDIACGTEDAFVVIAGDKKTPESIVDFCSSLMKTSGVPIFYLSPDFQKDYSPPYSNSLGWNTVQRRNMAILFAYRQGADIIVTIDDDNFMTHTGYLKFHGDLVKEKSIVRTQSATGWLNICKPLSRQIFYPRGYSIAARGQEEKPIYYTENTRCVVNAGLWVGDPDIDAVTRLAINPKSEIEGNVCTEVLAPRTYCPFNSQNTALHRDVIPAYCMTSGTGRYDDIIPSFFVKRIADHLNHGIRFGHPVVRQKRNAHNIWKDLNDEKIGMQMTDPLVDWLRTITLTGADYRECIKELITAFRERWLTDGSLSFDQRAFMFDIVHSYENWSKVI